MAKYLRIASDLHLEAFAQRNPDTLFLDFLPKDERDSESILVLAGDISSVPTQLAFFLRACLERFPHVVFVPGNHEYYRHNFDAWNRKMKDELPLLRQEGRGFLHFATQGIEVTDIQSVRFIFGTMWADGGHSLADQGQVGWYLNDFRVIHRDGHGDLSYRPVPRRFTVSDMIAEFKSAKARIDELLKQPYDGKTVVVTHHLPSRRLVSARFWPKDGSDGANGGFVGDCESILAYDHAPDIWVHGHTHDTIDTTLWKTRVVCNPAGYRGEWTSQFNSYMPAVPGESGAKFVELA